MISRCKTHGAIVKFLWTEGHCCLEDEQDFERLQQALDCPTCATDLDQNYRKIQGEFAVYRMLLQASVEAEQEEIRVGRTPGHEPYTWYTSLDHTNPRNPRIELPSSMGDSAASINQARILRQINKKRDELTASEFQVWSVEHAEQLMQKGLLDGARYCAAWGFETARATSNMQAKQENLKMLLLMAINAQRTGAIHKLSSYLRDCFSDDAREFQVIIDAAEFAILDQRWAFNEYKLRECKSLGHQHLLIPIDLASMLAFSWTYVLKDAEYQLRVQDPSGMQGHIEASIAAGCYRLGEFAEATERFKRASVQTPSMLFKLKYKLYAARAAMGIGAYATTADLALTVLLNAYQRNLAPFVMRAELILREMMYRRGRAVESDRLSRFEMMKDEVNRLAAVNYLVLEGALAWRKRDLRALSKIWQHAEKLVPNDGYTSISQAYLLRALKLSAFGGTEKEIHDLARSVVFHNPPAICIQVLGLLATTKYRDARWLPIAADHIARVGNPELRREVLSFSEALLYLSSGSSSVDSKLHVLTPKPDEWRYRTTWVHTQKTYADLRKMVEEDPASARAFVQSGEWVFDVTGEAYPPLVAAIEDDDVEMMRVLLDMGADPYEPSCYNDHELSAVNVAASKDLRMLKMLVTHGSPEGSPYPPPGFTSPLMRAAAANAAEAVEWLIQTCGGVNYVDHDGWTALMCAAQNSGLEVTKILIRHGADPTVREPDEGLTAEDLAIQRDDWEIADLLFEASPSMDD